MTEREQEQHDAQLDAGREPEETETEYSDAHQALAEHLGVDPSELEPTRYDDTCFEHGNAEYRVLTETERQAAADEALENYIDECLLPEADAGDRAGSVVQTLRQYFDRAGWKRDALLSDGYGHTLSSYDGEEHEVGGFYIYRVN